jgi:hypothetical protein
MFSTGFHEYIGLYLTAIEIDFWFMLRKSQTAKILKEYWIIFKARGTFTF